MKPTYYFSLYTKGGVRVIRWCLTRRIAIREAAEYFHSTPSLIAGLINKELFFRKKERSSK